MSITLREELTRKYTIIYKGGGVWQSDNESHAIARLDSDENIIAAVTRYGDQYKLVYGSEEFITGTLIGMSEKEHENDLPEDYHISEGADIGLR